MRQTWMWLATAAVILALTAGASAQVRINEARIDDQGSAGNVDPDEYFELQGEPGLPIGDLTYVVLGRRPIETISGIPWGGAGVIVNMTQFPASATIPANGRYLVNRPTMPPQWQAVTSLFQDLGFEDDATQTHLLVRNFDYSMFDDATPPTVGFSPLGFDLDLDNDGILDIVPWGEVVDGVSILKSNTFDVENRAYSPTHVGPASYGIPAHVFRCGNNANWRVGVQKFRARVVATINKTTPTTSPFDSTHALSATLTGITQAGSDVLVKVTLKADMNGSSETVKVLFAGTTVATLTGGFSDCASSVREFTVPRDLFNSIRCGLNNTLPVQVAPNSNVGFCPGSTAKVNVSYTQTDGVTSDTPGKVNPDCLCSCSYPAGTVDVVFVMDTSGSMDDEAAALCATIPTIVSSLGSQGLLVLPTVWGITDSPGGAFSCLTGNVANALGTGVPNASGTIIGQLDAPESWGDAAAIVASRFPWTPGHARLVVTISDEAPYQGNGPGNTCDAADTFSVANAVSVANSKGVVVSTLVGTGAVACVEGLAAAMAEGTGGGTATTTIPADEIGDILASFILNAAANGVCGTCLGDLNHDGVVSNTDFGIYNCSTNFACKDVNNDSITGAPADRAYVINFHDCGPAEYCGSSAQSCLVQHSNPGCANAGCCAAVCSVEPSCCDAGWDGGCVVLALSLCGSCGNSLAPQSCFTDNGPPGCDNASCCQLVCAQDPTCCAASWDALCAAIARQVCLGCGDDQLVDCFLPNSIPGCIDTDCCTKVCVVDPTCCSAGDQWDVNCVALARILCASCGEQDLSPCGQAQFNPSCKDQECCQTVCAIDPFCCEVQWDDNCVARAQQVCLLCGSLLAGSCCVAHLNPYCNDQDCCEQVCALDPFCCTSSWDTVCVSLSSVICTSLACPCGVNPASCFSPHPSAGCNERICCEITCTHDTFCCLVEWDTLCAEYAQAQCGTNGACVPGSGSCTVPHLTPGCDDPLSCCSLVCSQLPECCDVAWDELCVAAAFQTCQQCGNPSAGSCYTDHGSAGCSDVQCCQAVCNVDPFCCTIAWDGGCASQAFTICGDPSDVCGTLGSGPEANRNCFMPSTGRGCTNYACCGIVCNNYDSYCCEVNWDAICAKEAASFCVMAGNTDGRGDCFTPHCCSGGPDCVQPCAACSDRGCASAVCNFDPTCCSVVWDESCVELALAVCVDREICPSPGLCQAQHRNPGCNDAACCHAVCDIDPTCCQITWDSGCAQTARDYCKPKTGWECPCEGSCLIPRSSPGCEDPSCCSAVCNIDPSCCIDGWDINCVSQARATCCGLGFCGDSCGKSCLVVHAAPFCNDSFCCAAVCNIDPFCCDQSWDTLCVQAALQRCTGGCGQPEAGNCFNAHDGRGCSLGECCADVCRVMPECCQAEWDQACVDLAKTTTSCFSEKPKCGQSIAGKCCEAHPSPACQNITCCIAVCTTDPQCCDVEWDELCAEAARANPSCVVCRPPCGDPCAGSCCAAHPNPNCSNGTCCNAVCVGWSDTEGTLYPGDTYCCDVVWDANCASMANEYARVALKSGVIVDGPCADACPQPECGSVLTGDCCNPHAGPFCIEADCCQVICNNDAYCCEVQWDVQCATAALSLCDTCASPAACGAGGSCYLIHLTPYCDDAICCELVCAVDPTCCSQDWDFNCVLTAVQECFVRPVPPANDECAGAFGAAEGVTPITNAAATTSAIPLPTVNCGSETFEFHADVWYVFTPPQSGSWLVSTCNLANFDTALAVYEGTCGSLLLRSCSNDSPFCAQLTSQVTLTMNAGQTYYIRIGSPIDDFSTGTGFLLIKTAP